MDDVYKMAFKAFTHFLHGEDILVFLPNQEKKKLIEDSFLWMIDTLWGKENFYCKTWNGIFEVHHKIVIKQVADGTFTSTPIHDTYLCGRRADVIITDEETWIANETLSSRVSWDESRPKVYFIN